MKQGGFCINCDNRHGCKSGTPPCLGRMALHHVKNESGKEYLTRTGNLSLCIDCPFFRSCWNSEEYDRKVGETGDGGGKAGGTG